MELNQNYSHSNYKHNSLFSFFNPTLKDLNDEKERELDQELEKLEHQLTQLDLYFKSAPSGIYEEEYDPILQSLYEDFQAIDSKYLEIDELDETRKASVLDDIEVKTVALQNRLSVLSRFFIEKGTSEAS